MREQPTFDLKHGDVPVLTLSGDFDPSSDDVLIAAFRQLIESKPQCVIVNISRVVLLGNWAMGELARHLIQLKQRDVQVNLVAEPNFKRNTEWLMITKLDQVFDTYRTEAEAVRNASRSREP